MLAKEQQLRRNVVEILCLENLVLLKHLLHQIEGAVDFVHFAECCYWVDTRTTAGMAVKFIN